MSAFVSILTLAAIVAIQILAGGRNLALCLPSYGLLGIAALLGWWQTRGLEIPRRVAPALAASLLFFGYVIVRTLFSPEEYIARRDLYMVLAALVVYLLVALNFTSSELRARFAVVLLVLAAAHVALGVIQFKSGENTMAFSFLPRPDYGTRASGFFGYPNHLAAFLETAMSLGLGLVFWSRWRPWVKIVAAYFVVVCIAGIILSGSRGGFVSALAGLIVFAVLSLLVVCKRSDKSSILLAVASVIVAAMLAVGIRWAINESVALSERATSGAAAMSPRLMLWAVAVKQFQAQPVFGAGSGSFFYFSREFKPPGIQTDPEYAHNDYLQFLAEYGTAGAACFLLFLVVHLRSGWKAFRHTISRESEILDAGSNSLALGIGALSAATACMVHATVDFPLHSPAVTLVIAFVFGLLADSGGEPERGFQMSRQFRLATPLLGIALLAVALPKLPAELYAERARLIQSDWRHLALPEVARTAEQLARRGVECDSSNPELFYCLGEALTAQAAMATEPADKDRLNSAAALAHRRALALAPRDSRHLVCLASTLDALQRFDEAAPLLAEAIRRDPLSRYAHWAWAHHFELQNKLDEAEEAYLHCRHIGGAAAAQSGLDRIAEMRKAQTPAPESPPKTAP